MYHLKHQRRIKKKSQVRFDSHPCLLVFAIVPAVTGLGHQQGDHVALGEAQQCAVVPCSVGKDGLDSGSSVPLQTGGHGAGAGQRASLHWKKTHKKQPQMCHSCWGQLSDNSFLSNIFIRFSTFICTSSRFHFKYHTLYSHCFWRVIKPAGCASVATWGKKNDFSSCTENRKLIKEPRRSCWTALKCYCFCCFMSSSLHSKK